MFHFVYLGVFVVHVLRPDRDKLNSNGKVIRCMLLVVLSVFESDHSSSRHDVTIDVVFS